MQETTAKLISLSPVDVAIIVIYFAMVIGIGIYLKKYASKGEGFFLAGREMSAWVAGLAFISANLGALELMGWASEPPINTASWRFIGIGSAPYPPFCSSVSFLMPFYYISKTHSVPGFLKLRYGEGAPAGSMLFVSPSCSF